MARCADTRVLRRIAATGVCIVAVACARDEAAQRADSAQPSPLASLSAEEVREGLLAEARGNYTYASQRTAESVSADRFVGAGGTIPTITIATATRRDSTGRIPRHHFVARYVSSAAYPEVGYAPDTNYIWRDSASVADGGPFRTLIVPVNAAYPMVWLQHDSGSVLEAPVPEPRLLQNSTGYQGCDQCDFRHCTYARKRRDYRPDDAATIRIRR